MARVNAEGAGKAQQRVRRVVRPIAKQSVEVRARGLRPPARRRSGHPVPEPRQLPRQRVLDAARAAQHQLRRQGRVHGLVEDEVPVPADGHDPHRPRRWRQEPGRPRHGRGRAAPRRAVRHLPGGHAQPRRDAAQGPHRRGAAGVEGRLPDLPGGHHRHPRDPAARRQAAEAAAARARSRSAGRSTSSATAIVATTTWSCARSPTS